MAVNNIQRYSFAENDQLFFDTNVWFLIYGPQSPKDKMRQKIYSRAFQEIISKGSNIYIDAVTLAELINLMVRFHFDLWCEQNKLSLPFKSFRAMKEYKPIAEEIEKVAQMVLIDASPIETGFSNMDTSKMLGTFRKDRQDFNDLVIADICRKRKLVLVTDDSDFQNSDIEILTSNRRLLNA